MNHSAVLSTLTGQLVYVILSSALYLLKGAVKNLCQVHWRFCAPVGRSRRARRFAAAAR
jgi:hypothetical protein